MYNPSGFKQGHRTVLKRLSHQNNSPKSHASMFSAQLVSADEKFNFILILHVLYVRFAASIMRSSRYVETMSADRVSFVNGEGLKTLPFSSCN
ncbi:hypothetical protein B0H34DRAFT_724426 [Crassisporium funariophilum]|nr:hypothetical protein B0H34DRAFT_724426 [Crassisporium funariophilum]